MFILLIVPTLFTFVTLFLFGNKLGVKGSSFIAVINMGITLFFSIFLFVKVAYFGNIYQIELFTWLIFDGLKLDITLLLDSVTSIMLIVINFISFLVHVYTIDYMKGDRRIIAFFATISMFTFFMIMLVTSSNYVVLFFGWEGVGVASFLLIRYWRHRIAANKSAIKAMILNRVGDFGLILGICLIFFTFKSLDYSVIFSCCEFFSVDFFNILGFNINKLTLISLLLFIGAMGKSAQIGLHLWLPDAMEGPTPVSALIHAATMVTAGVFLLIRSSPLLEYSSTILIMITIVGALTAFFGATTGLVQNDLKRVIAYSTCSQLGYMVFACGLSNYSVGLFHLMNHAFFKALLFLCAGSVIHALNDEQDMRKMGGLFKLLPFTYIMMLIGSLSLMGFPFLTGFYSKDVILEISYSSFSIYGSFAYWLGVLSAFCTAFYSFRLLYLTFYSKPNGYKNVIYNAHECSMYMLIPLVILGIGSIFFGFFFKDLLIGLGTPFFGNSIFIKTLNYNQIDSEFLPFYIKLIPVFFSLLGMLVALLLYICFSYLLNKYLIKTFLLNIYIFLNKRWYFDLIYNYLFTQPSLYFSYEVSFKILDRGFLEFIGPLGLVRFLNNLSKFLNNLNTGYIYHYGLFFILSTITIIFIFYMVLFTSFISFFLTFKLYFIFVMCYFLIFSNNKKNLKCEDD